MARPHIERLIMECQPDYARTELPRSIATKIAKIEGVAPFDLFEHWVTLGTLSCMLADFEMLYDSFIAVQDAACQFEKEEVWISGAKYSFGLSVFFLMQNADAHKNQPLEN